MALFLMISLISFVSADDPIVYLSAQCPLTASGSPSLHLTADVPAFAMAKCRNGDKSLIGTDEVNFRLGASFGQSYSGDLCQFYKKDGSNTYTVDVEVGWGERDAQILQQRKIHTISCAYDAHGRSISSSKVINDWFLNPWEVQTLLGGNSAGTFTVKVVDVLGREITDDHISIGRKIQLIAEDTSGNTVAFRALSCSVQNAVSRYYIIRAGCGDGLVFPKTSGFQTIGNQVVSPYFDAFKLAGGDHSVEFSCRFTECDGPCDGDSCTVLNDVERAKRSITNILNPSIHSKSTTYYAR